MRCASVKNPMSLCQSETKQRRFLHCCDNKCLPAASSAHVFFGGDGRVPLDFRIRRILLPATSVSTSLPASRDSATRTSDDLDLGNTVGVAEDDTDLGRSSTLLGELADLVNDLVAGDLEPRRSSARVGDGGGRDALSLAVKTTHFGDWRAGRVD